jgi:hypothetical protein
VLVGERICLFVVVIRPASVKDGVFVTLDLCAQPENRLHVPPHVT